MKSMKKYEESDALEELQEEVKNVKKTRTISPSKEHKSLPSDPWQLVSHKALSARKALSGPKSRTKIKAKQITSQKKFSKISNAMDIAHRPLQQRKAIRVNLDKETVAQVIKSTLKDYNSIEFLIQSHAAD
jgi:hypothetical protein